MLDGVMGTVGSLTPSYRDGRFKEVTTTLAVPQAIYAHAPRGLAPGEQRP
jgi:hypothetical protein